MQQGETKAENGAGGPQGGPAKPGPAACPGLLL